MQLVGRQTELAALRDAIDAAGRGRGSYVGLVGEPGIGKTRLAEEAAAIASAAGFDVVWGRCWEIEGAPALWPWIQVMRALHAGDEWERGAAGERFELFDQAAGALREAAAVRPRLVILDDLHAADRSSLLLLHFVVRQIRHVRGVVIGTYRDVEARLRADAAALLAKVAREGSVLPLRRLDRGAVAELARDRLADSIADAIYRATEGNPLFVAELLRLVELGGATIELAIPDGIRAAIAEHLRLVPAATRELLEAAALLGRELEGAALAELVGEPFAAVRGRLDEAIRASLIAEPAPGQLRFCHVRIRDVLDDELSADRRCALHRAAAEVLERRGGGDAAIAHHWFAAGVTDRAIAAAERAAVVAMRRHAYDEAAALLTRALDAGSGLPATRRAELVLALAAATIRAGNAEAGQRLCEQAAEQARALAVPELLARAALTHGTVYRFGRSDRALVAMLEEALARLPETDSPLRAQLLGRLAGALQPADHLVVPVTAARRAIEMARRLGDPPTLLSVLVSAGSALQDVVDATERVSINQEIVRLGAAANDPLVEARGHLRLAFDHLELGRVEAADACFRDHEGVIAELRNPRLHWPPALYRALRADMAGEHDDAAGHAEDARRLAERAGDDGARGTLAMHEVCSAILRDDRDAMLRAEGVLAEHAYHAIVHEVIGTQLALRLGRLDEARARVAAMDTSAIVSWATEAPAAACIGEVVAAAGSAELQREVYDALVGMADAGRVGVWGMTAMGCLGPVARSAYLLASALGRRADAERHLAQAIAIARAIRHAPILARLEREAATRSLAVGADAGVVRSPAAGADAGATRSRAIGEAADAREPRAAGTVAATHEPVGAATRRRLAVEPLALTCEGDVWALAWRGETYRVRDSRGLHMIAQLVARAGDDIHVLDLAGAGGTIDAGDAGEHLDRTALAAYRQRRSDLASELADAEDANDLARVERARDELDALGAELARAVGLGGRARRGGGAAERARINVQRRIRNAIERVQEACPALGEHLSRSLRTGSFCCYVPRP